MSDIAKIQVITTSENLKLVCSNFGKQYEIFSQDETGKEYCYFRTSDMSDKGWDETLAQYDFLEARLDLGNSQRLMSHSLAA